MNHPLTAIIALWAFGAVGVLVTRMIRTRSASSCLRATIIILSLTAATVAVTFAVRGAA
jgi:hypothetical protein